MAHSRDITTFIYIEYCDLQLEMTAAELSVKVVLFRPVLSERRITSGVTGLGCVWSYW